jgi:large subunit ribosomal protein L31e
MVEEKILTINLRKKMIKVAKWRRSKDYVKFLKENLKRNFKTDKIKIDQKLNEKIWKRSIENPPLKIRIKAIKSDDGTVKVELMD